MASGLAEAHGAELHLLHVLEPEPTYTAYGFTPDEFPAIHTFQEEARKRAKQKLDELLAQAAGGIAGGERRTGRGKPAAGDWLISSRRRRPTWWCSDRTGTGWWPRC